MTDHARPHARAAAGGAILGVLVIGPAPPTTPLAGA
jgi:hypothetical protein